MYCFSKNIRYVLSLWQLSTQKTKVLCNKGFSWLSWPILSAIYYYFYNISTCILKIIQKIFSCIHVFEKIILIKDATQKCNDKQMTQSIIDFIQYSRLENPNIKNNPNNLVTKATNWGGGNWGPKTNKCGWTHEPIGSANMKIVGIQSTNYQVESFVQIIFYWNKKWDEWHEWTSPIAENYCYDSSCHLLSQYMTTSNSMHLS